MSQQQTLQIPVQSEATSHHLQILGFPLHYFAYLVIALFLIALLKLRKKKVPKDQIVLIGERNSGKTQLFISLNKGKRMKTAPSIHNNKTVSEVKGKKYEMVDYIGDNISKEEILQTMDSIHLLIHVIDGTDQKSLSDAGMLIYKTLVSKAYQQEKCNYLIFLNKSDAKGYIGKLGAEKRLNDEIEHIKRARINQGEENENEEDYIKLSKERFKLPFQVIEGSAEMDIKDLQMSIESL